MTTEDHGDRVEEPRKRLLSPRRARPEPEEERPEVLVVPGRAFPQLTRELGVRDVFLEEPDPAKLERYADEILAIVEAG